MAHHRLILRAFVKNIYRLLPPKVQHTCAALVWSCRNIPGTFMDALFPPVYIVRGSEKHSGTPMSFAYAGNRGQTRTYWAQAALQPGWVMVELGRFYFQHVPRVLAAQRPTCAFLLTEHTAWTLPYLSCRPGFRIPHWIDMEMDISGPMTALLGTQRPHIERRIRTNELSYSMSRDLRDFDDFYHHMYTPYIRGRYGSQAQLTSYGELRWIFTRGELMLIRGPGGEILGGSLVEQKGCSVHCHKLGIRDGNHAYVRRGVIGAGYYFLIKEMKGRGCTHVRLGGTRPLLNDGVTKLKISLDAAVVPKNRNSCAWLELLKNSDGLRSFLIHNPFVFIDEEHEGYQAVFIDFAAGDNVLDGLADGPACRGIKGMRVFIFEEAADKGGPEDDEAWRSIRPARALFTSGYS